MKYMLLIALLAFSSLAFAQYECEESCCYAFNGDWDADFDMCNDHNVGYLQCVDECIYGPSDDPYSASASYSCCGPAFMLVGLVGAVLFLKK